MFFISFNNQQQFLIRLDELSDRKSPHRVNKSLRKLEFYCNLFLILGYF